MTAAARRLLLTGMISLLAGPATGAGLQFGGLFELGYDSFAQRYSLADDFGGNLANEEAALRDTLDVFNEFKARTGLEFEWEGEAWRWRLDSRLSAGTELNRGGAQLQGGYREGGRSVLFDFEGDLRRYREGSDFSLSSDSEEFNARLRWRERSRSTLGWWIEARGQALDHEFPDIYQLDHRQVDLQAALIARRDWSKNFELRLGGGARDLPDSSGISWRRAIAAAHLDWEVAEDGRLRIEARSERRIYRDSSLRSPWFSQVLELEYRWALSRHWELRPSLPLEWVFYDDNSISSVFEDFSLGRAGFQLRHRRDRIEVAFEPRYSWQSNPASPSEAWRQWGALAEFQLRGPRGLWLSLREEFGRRDYGEDATEEFILTTDYIFLRTTLLLSTPFWKGSSVDLFVSDEPESHRDRGDDSRLTLFTISLRQRF